VGWHYIQITRITLGITKGVPTGLQWLRISNR
jgi:hypothetical protein